MNRSSLFLLIGLSLRLPIGRAPGPAPPGLSTPTSHFPIPNSYLVLRLPPEALTNLPADRVTVARQGGLGPLVLLTMPDPFDWSRFSGVIEERHQPRQEPGPVNLTLSSDASPGYPLLAGWSAPVRPVGWHLKVAANASITDLVIVPICPAYSHGCIASVSDEKETPGPDYLLKADASELLSLSWNFTFLAPHQAGLLPPIICFPAHEPGWRDVIEALRPL